MSGRHDVSPRWTGMFLGLGLLLLLLIPSPAHGLAAKTGLSNADCFACHSDSTTRSSPVGGTTHTLFVPAATYAASSHANLSCAECHLDATAVPHAEKLARVDCSGCHAGQQAEYEKSIHGQAYAWGEEDAPRCTDCHGTHDITGASDPTSKVYPQHVAQTCARCHADPRIVQKYDITARAPVDAYEKSIHGRALRADSLSHAATCSSCHPAHGMLRAIDPTSTVNKANIATTCGACHGEISKIYQESVHGVAAARGKTDAPVCTDCHGEHGIQEHTNPASAVFPDNINRTTCTRCHESQILAGRYGFDADRLSSYRETYHGLASTRGALNVANCASCHGIHNIFSSSDFRSTVNPANLQQTCGTCHPSASAEFAAIQVHPSISGATGQPGQARPAPRPSDVARDIYVFLLLSVIGGMAAHNAIIWVYHVVEKRRREKGMTRVRRFSTFEAREHLILLTSFFILTLTGFALKFPDSGWVNLTERLGLTEALRSLIHRIAAVVMLGVSLVQVGYLFFTAPGRRELRELRPGARDVSDFLHNMAYHLRLRKDRPTFPHFDYTEKAEYLALIWGTVIMALTGFVLWFPAWFTRMFPAWIFEVSEVIHYYEAWLAFLAIVVWHFFYVLFGPEATPMKLTWMDGLVPADEVVHRHGHLPADAEIVPGEPQSKSPAPPVPGAEGEGPSGEGGPDPQAGSGRNPV